MTLDAMIDAARRARENAIAPYSRFRVGATLRTTGGVLYSGCNIENASFGLTVCAERVALLTALARGERSFDTLVVVTPADEPATPCGPCRQLLWEYCRDLEVILVNLEGVTRTFGLAELLPHPFDHLPEV